MQDEPWWIQPARKDTSNHLQVLIVFLRTPCFMAEDTLALQPTPRFGTGMASLLSCCESPPWNSKESTYFYFTCQYLIAYSIYMILYMYIHIQLTNAPTARAVWFPSLTCARQGTAVCLLKVKYDMCLVVTHGLTIRLMLMCLLLRKWGDQKVLTWS